MSKSTEAMERALLELGADLYRLKHRMDELERREQNFGQIFQSLKKLLDEKGLISSDDFEEAVALDSILGNPAVNSSSETLSLETKKVVN